MLNMLQTLSIRKEKAEDRAAVYQVNKLAFGRDDEAQLVDRLRDTGASLLSLVAIYDGYAIGGEIVGHILFSAVTVNDGDSSWQAVGLAPLAVMPAFQKQGIASTLVRAGLVQLSAEGYEVVFVLGHPEFYPRFGFEVSARYGIRPSFDVPEEVFMVTDGASHVLRNEILAKPRSGIVHYHSAFDGL